MNALLLAFALACGEKGGADETCGGADQDCADDDCWGTDDCPRS